MGGNFDPKKGIIHRATCLVCGAAIDNNTTSKLFSEGKSSEKIIAAILSKEGHTGKKYRLSNENDNQLIKRAENYLETKRRFLLNEWGIDSVT